jgi:tRNA dimethylallyltransferase
VLNTERQILHQRIDSRVDQMIGQGLEDEARSLYIKGGSALQPGQAIGYKEFFPFFEGKITKEQAIEQIKTNSHRLAKKQITFSKNQFQDVNWFDPVTNPKDISKINKLVEGFINN